MKSVFHSLTDFELGNKGQPVDETPLVVPRTAPKRPSPPMPGLRAAVAPPASPSKAPPPPAPEAPPSRSRGKGFVPFEDRITRAVKAVLPDLGLDAATRLRKEKLTEPEGWRIVVDLSGDGVPKSLATARALVFEVRAVDGSTEQVSVRLDLDTGKSRARLGKASGPSSQESLVEMCRKTTRYVNAGLVR